MRLNIWDTEGQEKFRSVTRQYYLDSYGANIAFDLTIKKTFDEVNKWINELKCYGSEDTVIIILGNKSDLSNERAISEDDIREELKINIFIEM